MKTTIISNISGNRNGKEHLEKLKKGLKKSGISCDHYELEDQDIRSCNGCWGCWVKTPGKCHIPDDMETILRSFIHSDQILFIDKPVMGFVSGSMKIAMDRTIPLVHPYIEIVEKESHHKKRYSKYPKLGVVLHDTGSLEKRDKEIIKNIFQRYALNFKSKLKIFSELSVPVKEIIDEINSI